MHISLPNEKTVEHSHHPSVQSKGKRLIDVVGALIGITATVFLFLPIAIAIKQDSSGSILYSQYRCGLNGRYFRIWKFRSMVNNAEELKKQVKNEASGHIFKNRSDPRVTSVGRFLRKTSLDELPQFWNVLRGEMSLVGTRPPTPDEVKNYDSHHRQRLGVKPGITGEWQVHGRSDVESFDTIVQMDLHYQSEWSILYDFKLIIKTIVVVLRRQGAC